MVAIPKDDMCRTLTSTHCRINADICKGDELPVHGELWACHVVCADGGMMADLLIINWDSFYVGYESLA